MLMVSTGKRRRDDGTVIYSIKTDDPTFEGMLL